MFMKYWIYNNFLHKCHTSKFKGARTNLHNRGLFFVHFIALDLQIRTVNYSYHSYSTFIKQVVKLLLCSYGSGTNLYNKIILPHY